MWTVCKPLVKEEAAAQQDLDNAIAALQANEANVNSRKANVEQMRLSTQAQIDTTAAQVDSTKAQLSDRATEFGVRDDSGAHQRPDRRQPDSGGRPGDQDFDDAADDDRAAGPDLGAVQGERSGISGDADGRG